MMTLTFASLAYENKKRQTRREMFLEEMDRVIPWKELLQVIKGYYPKAGNGRQPMPLERMLRIYFMQQWYGLSDPAMEDALYDSESMRRFAGIDIAADVIPDETTILHFRHLLEKHNLTRKIFEKTKQYLSEKGLLLREGTIVDATIISAPSSTKNQNNARDPEMKQTKKGNQWYFGMKAHVGTDTGRGLTHSVVVTDASVHDSQVMDELLHGEEQAVYGDRAYTSKKKKEESVLTNPLIMDDLLNISRMQKQKKKEDDNFKNSNSEFSKMDYKQKLNSIIAKSLEDLNDEELQYLVLKQGYLSDTEHEKFKPVLGKRS